MARHRFGTLALSLAAALVTSALQCNDDKNTDQRASAKQLWSGWWWPQADAVDPNLYDADHAMHRFWDYILATRDPAVIGGQKSAQTLERDKHACTSPSGCSGTDVDVCGHCQPVAAAVLKEAEPTRIIRKTIVRQLDAQNRPVFFPPGGAVPDDQTFTSRPQEEIKAARVDVRVIEFRVRHQKGLLAELWYAPPHEAVGSAIGAGTALAGPDITPRQFHEKLFEWVPAGAAMDVHPGADIWHHPIQKFDTEWTDGAPNAQGQIPRTFSTLVTLVANSSGADPDYVGLSTITRVYNYTIPMIRNPDDTRVFAGDGAWDPKPNGRRGDRPGNIWRVNGPPAPNLWRNPQITDACVREILRGDETILIKRKSDYRPWPCR